MGSGLSVENLGFHRDLTPFYLNFWLAAVTMCNTDKDAKESFGCGY